MIDANSSSGLKAQFEDQYARDDEVFTHEAIKTCDEKSC